jgi:transposase
MAYKQKIIKQAEQMYIVEGKSCQQISDVLNINLKTIYIWRTKYGWDKVIRDSGNIGLAMELQKSFTESIQKAIKEGKLTDPATADALWKTSKLMEKLLPEKILLSNIYNFLEDVVNFAREQVDDDAFKNGLTRYLPEIAEHLKRKYCD